MIEITYLVHGATADNENGIATGTNDISLSELGVTQAKNQGKLLANKKFDVMFCSDLKRAVESARLGFGKREFEIIPDKRLREIDCGDLNGKPAITFRDKMDEYVDKTFPNGESYKQVQAKIEDLLHFLKTNYDGKRVVLLAHQAPQLALEVLLNGKSWQQAIDEDWRKTMSWQPGWEYELK